MFWCIKVPSKIYCCVIKWRDRCQESRYEEISNGFPVPQLAFDTYTYDEILVSWYLTFWNFYKIICYRLPLDISSVERVERVQSNVTSQHNVTKTFSKRNDVRQARCKLSSHRVPAPQINKCVFATKGQIYVPSRIRNQYMLFKIHNKYTFMEIIC